MSQFQKPGNQTGGSKTRVTCSRSLFDLLESNSKPSIWLTLGPNLLFRPRVSQIEGFGLLYDDDDDDYYLFIYLFIYFLLLDSLQSLGVLLGNVYCVSATTRNLETTLSATREQFQGWPMLVPGTFQPSLL